MKKEKSGKYKCVKCGELFDSFAGNVVRCPACASKIIFKVRQPITKEIKAR